MNQNSIESFISRYRIHLMGFAILCVMLTHSSIQLGTGFYIFKQISQSGVDIFFFLSGYGLCSSFAKNKKGFYKRRFIRIIPTYLIVIIPYVLFLIARSNPVGPVLWEYSLISYYTDGILTEWFVSAVVLLYLTFPITYAIIRNPKLFYISIVFLWSVALFCSFSSWQFQTGIKTVAETFVVRIPVFITGSYIKMHEKTMKRHRIGVYVSMFVLSVLLILIVRNRVESYWTLVRILFYPLVISICHILSRLFSMMPTSMLRPFEFLGGITFEIYLIHEKILSFLSAVFVRLKGVETNHSMIWSIAVNITAVILSAAVAYLTARIVHWLIRFFQAQGWKNHSLP